jgi:hypothetical protein
LTRSKHPVWKNVIRYPLRFSMVFVSANSIHPLHWSWLVRAGACGRLERKASAAIVEEAFWKTNIATEHVAATATETDGHALRAVTWLLEREGRIVKGRVPRVPEGYLEVLVLEKLSAFFNLVECRSGGQYFLLETHPIV